VAKKKRAPGVPSCRALRFWRCQITAEDGSLWWEKDPHLGLAAALALLQTADRVVEMTRPGEPEPLDEPQQRRAMSALLPGAWDFGDPHYTAALYTSEHQRTMLVLYRHC
jgi:hypothetical protein